MIGSQNKTKLSAIIKIKNKRIINQMAVGNNFESYLPQMTRSAFKLSMIGENL